MRLKGVMGYGNPPAPDTPPGLNSVTMSSRALHGGEPPGSVLVPFPINRHIFPLNAKGVSRYQDFILGN